MVLSCGSGIIKSSKRKTRANPGNRFEREVDKWLKSNTTTRKAQDPTNLMGMVPYCDSLVTSE
jgi:hypothetical protein